MSLSGDNSQPGFTEWARFVAGSGKGAVGLELAASAALPFPRPLRMLRVNPAAVAEVEIQELEDGQRLAAYQGAVDGWNNRLTLNVGDGGSGGVGGGGAGVEEEGGSGGKRARLFGQLTVGGVKAALKTEGFRDVSVEAQSGPDFILTLVSWLLPSCEPV